MSTGLINELLLGRYALPPSTNPDSLLARHETALFAELRAIAAESPNHRSEEVSRRVLPRCQPMMEAIGHRMAYDAAVAQGVRPALVDLFVANALQFDAAWYAECTGVGRAQMQAMQESAMDRVLPILGELVAEMDVFAYVSAPIVSDERWGAFVEGLATFEGTAHVDALEPAVQAQPEMVRSHL